VVIALVSHLAANERIVATAAGALIPTSATIDPIVSRPSIEVIVSGISLDIIVTIISKDHVVAAATLDGVGPVSARELIATGVSENSILTVAAI